MSAIVLLRSARPSLGDAHQLVGSAVRGDLVFDRLLTDLCAVASVASYAVLALLAAGAVAERLAGQSLPRLARVLRVVVPRRWAAMVASACGLGLAATPVVATPVVATPVVATPVVATPVTAVAEDRARHPSRPSLDGLALPDLPIGRAAPMDEAVIVQPGDTLWAVAARRLPSSADDAEIAAIVHRWYAVNHRVIGSDPDLIFPGTHLEPPGGNT